MDIYLKQQHQNNPILMQESQNSIQKVNYTQMPLVNNNNQVQIISQQIPQSVMMYQANSIPSSQNMANIFQKEYKQTENDSNKEQTFNTSIPTNYIDSASSSNNLHSINSNETSNSPSPVFSVSKELSQESQSENNSQDKYEINNNSDNKQKKQNQVPNYTLTEIKGIIPNAGPDQQHVFVCRFSDSVNDEYVPNKQMRKRYPLQLIKFYESHIIQNTPRPNVLNVENNDIT